MSERLPGIILDKKKKKKKSCTQSFYFAANRNVLSFYVNDAQNEAILGDLENRGIRPFISGYKGTKF